MNNEECKFAQEYLQRFEQILCTMANEMLSYKMTFDITIDFICCMIPHHQAAIYMCENLLKYRKYEPLQQIANNIIKMQEDGIEKMKEIAKTTTGYFNYPEYVNLYISKYYYITNTMICKMKHSPKSLNINLDFTNEMIPHHEGAIYMCKNVLDYCIDPRLVKVANSIITEQSNGVEQLKNIRNTLSMK